LTSEGHRNICEVRKTRTSFISIILRFPSTSDSTRSSAWFGLAIRSRTDLLSVRLTNHDKQVQYTELQEKHILVSLSQ